MIKVKNRTNEVKIWCGKEFQPSEQYLLSESERVVFAYDSAFITAITDFEASVISDEVEVTDIVECELILRSEFKRDPEGNPIYRPIIAAKDMLFQPRCIDFTTGKLNSICNKASDLSNLADAVLLFFNDGYVEITRNESETDEQFQARLDQECYFTWLYFTPNHRYAIKSGEIRYKGTLGDESDVWIEIAPHIPKEYGGSVPFINGGLPLDFFDEKKAIVIDGGTCAIIELDSAYLSHRLGVKVEHGIGSKIGILATFNIYR